MWKLTAELGEKHTASGGRRIEIDPNVDSKMPAQTTIKNMYFKFDMPDEPLDILGLFKSVSINGRKLFDSTNVREWSNATCMPDKRIGYDKLLAAGYLPMDHQSTTTDRVDAIQIEFVDSAPTIQFEILYDLYTDTRVEQRNLRMYIVVNADLKMGKGKIGAQIGHGVAGVTERCLNADPARWAWYKNDGQPKICLKATQQQMAVLAGEETAVAVHDAGHTQVPAGSLTVVAFSPSEQEPHPMINTLKLL